MSKHYDAVDAIIADMLDRRGLKWEWKAIDEDIRAEIREEWARLVALHAGTVVQMPESAGSHRGPIWQRSLNEEQSGDGWLRAAIATGANEAYRRWFAAGDLRLELHISHVKELHRIANHAGWTIELHGPLHIMTSVGRATILWTWPDEDSLSFLDADKDGRRVIVRRHHPAVKPARKEREHHRGKTA